MFKLFTILTEHFNDFSSVCEKKKCLAINKKTRLSTQMFVTRSEMNDNPTIIVVILGYFFRRICRIARITLKCSDYKQVNILQGYYN